MKKLRFTLVIAIWFISTLAIAQNGVSIGNWRTHLPYQKVIGVEPIGNKIYAATQYELFYYDTQDNSINILNKINGLSDIGISCIGYNESQRKLLGLHVLQGKSYEEIAAETGLTPLNVRVQVSLARKKLKRHEEHR